MLFTLSSKNDFTKNMVNEVLVVDPMGQERGQIGRGKTMGVQSPGNQGGGKVSRRRERTMM